MKTLITIIIFSSSLNLLFSQSKKSEWSKAKIVMNDGASVISDIALNNDFFEGTLLVKDNSKMISLSPLQVEKFFVFIEDDTIEFRSVETRFLKAQGHKKSFIKVVEEGKEYSLFSKHIPNKKTTGFMLPVGGGWFLYGVIQYLKDEEIFFLEKNKIAHQISIPFKNYEYSDVIKTDKNLFKSLLGEDYNRVLNKTKKPKLRLKSDLIQVIKIANSLD